MYVANFFERLFEKCVNRGVRWHRGGVQEVHGWDNYVGGGQGLDKKFPELTKVRAKARKEKLVKKLNFLTGVINGLRKCTWWSNFFQETRSRLGLSNPRRKPYEIFAYDTVSG